MMRKFKIMRAQQVYEIASERSLKASRFRIYGEVGVGIHRNSMLS